MSSNFYAGLQQNKALLAAKYPRQFSGDNIGLGWPDGWNALVAEACQRSRELDPLLEWVQIKEKFGVLRMYYCRGSTHDDPANQSPSGFLIETRALLSAVIQEKEQESARTCMSCSLPAERMKIKDVIVTLCKSCEMKLRIGRTGNT